MNTRGKIQLISGLILEYFFENKAPAWTDISNDFGNYNITKLTGMERLSEDFLKIVFKNSTEIQEKVEFFKDHHHHLTILLLKEEYSLESCIDCGYLSRKISIGLEESIPRSSSNWMIHC